MLLTPSKAEEKVLLLFRSPMPIRGTASDVARRIHGDIDDVKAALDELVARGDLRRHDVPGERPVYWS